ncbi:MAG: hypothetical protein PHN90_12165 [Methanothrix sp.]|jgi:restriction endonuclease|nr:hypothetical protein [Methanothrix sp.]OPX81647.1 MAG: hypothetical protein A4E50_00857 [Methanosaeta sp. PtaB.Bin087]NLX39633.1 hypothetical protein [Methanothrix sp.]HNR58472.1 hypothetical protein [Methanothrix sp.]HNT72359.1 hypothetical protein [Methanothrix sp.]
MLDLEKIERGLLRGDLLDLDDEKLSFEMEAFLKRTEEQDRQISEILDALLEEVEELLSLSDELESEEDIRR